MSFDRVLITGGGGALASDLAERLSGRCELATPSQSELDIMNNTAVENFFASHEPELVLNCAAEHNMGVCEAEPERTFVINGTAVLRLAKLSSARGARFVTISSNYVFDGDRSEPYGEDDRPNPRSVYGISKLAGEYGAFAYAPDSLVVRTAGLFGLHGSETKGGNFVHRILAGARAKGELNVVADQLLNPTYTGDLADAILGAVEAEISGPLHLTNSGSCSWHEFAVAIVGLAGLDVPVHETKSDPDTGGGGRPLNGVLARPRADAAGVPVLRPWQDALADYMQRAGLAASSV
ncbi:MAG: dTDP-4-dehydrorhamnose reductase [Thermoleophilaceae bacterium]